MAQRIILELSWALIFIAAMLLWMLLERVLGLHSVHIGIHPIATNGFALVAVLVYVLALRHKRNSHYNGVMNWQQGFYTGLVITLIIALLSPITQWLVHTLISPHFFTNAATHAVQTELMTPEQAGEYFNLTAYIVQAFFGALILGVVTSAVVAIFVRSKPAT